MHPLDHHEQPELNGHRPSVHSSTSSKPNGRARHAPKFPFDEAEARRFLTAVDGEVDTFLFASGDDDKERRKRLFAEAKAENKPKPTVWRHRRGPTQVVRRWIEEQQENGWGCFVSVQAMKAAKCRIEELAYIRVIYAEMDISEPLKPWPIEPSIIVESSLGRFHVYWLILADDQITSEQFHGIMMCLVETYGSDPDSKDLARRLRLPGTWNLKPGREPHLVKVIHESGARYAGAELVAAFPAPPRPKPTASSARPTSNGRTSPSLERFVGPTGNGPIWSIRPDNYGDWVRVGMALHAETNGGSDGLSLWDRWSAASGSDKWAPGVCEAKWQSFGKRTGTNGGTIYHMASERGWTPPIRPAPEPAGDRGRQGDQEEARETKEGRGQPEPDPMAALAAEPLDEGERGILKTEANIRHCLTKAGVRVSYNAFARQRLVHGLPGYGPDLTDAAIDALWIRFEREHKVRFVRDHFNTVLRVEAHANSFHPVRDYLADLKWDGKFRLDQWLITYGGAADTPLIRQFGRLTLVGAVRRVRHPGSKFDTMLVLEGGEGRNKSTLFETLCGPQWFSDDAPLNAEARETIERLRGNWIIEAADLSAVKGTGVERLKAFLARKEDSATLKYERETTRAPRECIFVGTTNEAQYLQSKTGNRRFWPCRIGKIDIDALQGDRDQLWAEAAHYERAGATTVLPEELWPVAREAQEARREVDVWEEEISSWLEARRYTHPLVTTAEVARQVLGLEKGALDGRSMSRVTTAMRLAGWSKDAPGAKTVKGLRYWAPVEEHAHG